MEGHANKAYERFIREGVSPQIDIASYVVGELDRAAVSTEADIVYYTISAKKIQNFLEKKDNKDAPFIGRKKTGNSQVVGRTVKVLLDINDLKEDKDYAKKSTGGVSTKYVFSIEKQKVNRMKELIEGIKSKKLDK